MGLVAHKEEPLNLPDADQYPNFAYFEETGESSFHSFLGGSNYSPSKGSS